MTRIQSIEKKIAELPPNAINELEVFIDTLLMKSKNRKAGKLTQNWAGGLKEWKEKFTSLELQKKALEWRSK